MHGNIKHQTGFALVVVLSLVIVLGSLLIAYFTLTGMELSSSKSSISSTDAFYAAEAGLNLRAKEIRQTFEGFNRPNGDSPDGYEDCLNGSGGSGDFICESRTDLSPKHEVLTYVIDKTQGGDPELVRIPVGDNFAGLLAQEYQYTTYGVSVNKEDLPEAILGLVFKSRVVPMFQFFAFYNADFTMHPGPQMQGFGPIHVNGDAFINGAVNVFGQITVSERPDETGGDLYRGRKVSAANCTGNVQVEDNTDALRAITCDNGGRRLTDEVYLEPWSDKIHTHELYVEIPPPEEFQQGGEYWNNADLRLVYNIPGNDPNNNLGQIEVQDINGFAEANGRNLLAGCANSLPWDPADARYVGQFAPHDDVGPISASTTIWDDRQREWMTTLNIDVQGLLDCIDNNTGLLAWGSAGGVVGLADDTQGGLVIYASVVGPRDIPLAATTDGDGNPINPGHTTAVAPNNTGNPSRYAIRLFNGASLSDNDNNGLRGLSIISEEAAYIQGDFNLGQLGDGNQNNWRPAAVMVDMINILSNNWNDLDAEAQVAGGTLLNAQDTEMNVAFLGGIPPFAINTGGIDQGTNGTGNDGNGGLHNYPRFHENWDNQEYDYRGSFVTLGPPLFNEWIFRCCGDGNVYSPPDRNYGFDLRFQQAQNLPPMTPRAVYLKQELFERSFDVKGF